MVLNTVTNECDCIAPYILLENGLCKLVATNFNADCTGKPLFMITSGICVS